MFRFEHPYYLYALALVPILAFVFYWSWSFGTKRMKLLGDSDLVQHVILGMDSKRYMLRSILFLISIFLFIIALANPQWGIGREKAEAKGTDVFILFDISTSMLAQDIAPSRLERSKKFTSDLIRTLKGNRVGLVFFAGSAFLQMPLTLDYSAADLLIKSANTNQVGSQGTDITAALDVANKAYSKETNDQKAIIIISDGESHDDDAMTKIKAMQSNGWFIYTVGVGTEAGAYIPLPDRNGQMAYKKDENGELVKSSLNTQMIKEIADAGGGKAFLITDGNSAIRSIAENIEKLKKQELSVQSFANYNSYFHYFLALSFCALAVFVFIPESKNPKS